MSTTAIPLLAGAGCCWHPQSHLRRPVAPGGYPGRYPGPGRV